MNRKLEELDRRFYHKIILRSGSFDDSMEGIGVTDASPRVIEFSDGTLILTMVDSRGDISSIHVKVDGLCESYWSELPDRKPLRRPWESIRKYESFRDDIPAEFMKRFKDRF